MLKSRFIFIFSLFSIITFLSSCGHEPPPSMIYKYEQHPNMGMGMAYCCTNPGNNCHEYGHHTRSSLSVNSPDRIFIDSAGIKNFFLTKDWKEVFGNEFPQNIVDSIIAYNPKHQFFDNGGFVLKRDSTKGFEPENILVAFRHAVGDPCYETMPQF